MIGDKIVIRDYNRKGAELVMEHIRMHGMDAPLRITVSGESGSGKSEVAHCLKDRLEADGLTVIILAQDDYFRLPPHTSHSQRKADITWVGTSEVDLEWMNYHLKRLTDGNNNCDIYKPLVFFDEDYRGTEKVTGPYDVVIAEGTYTAMLNDANLRVFIDRNYRETKKDRLARNRDQALDSGRDKQLSFLEDVLEIEHQIIRAHKRLADVVIPPPSILVPDAK